MSNSVTVQNGEDLLFLKLTCSNNKEAAVTSKQTWSRDAEGKWARRAAEAAFSLPASRALAFDNAFRLSELVSALQKCSGINACFLQEMLFQMR